MIFGDIAVLLSFNWGDEIKIKIFVYEVIDRRGVGRVL